MQEFDVLILGGGAGGLMCAAWLNQHSTLHVGIIEGNAMLGKKLEISGGGKCNITNVDVSPKHYLGDEAFISEVFGTFGQKKLLEFLHVRGLQPVIRKERYYFCSESSKEIMNILKRDASKTTFLLNHKLLHVTYEQAFVVTTDRAVFRAKKVIVATGGESFKNIGASAIGLEIAKHFGHNVTPFQPALAGLTLQSPQFWMKTLSGISMAVQIRVDDRVIDEDLLFAHKGISGPAVLSASLYWHKGEIEIDFLPALHVNECLKGKKLLSSAIPLPKRFMKAFLQSENIEDKPCSKLTQVEITSLQKLHRYTLAPAGNFGFSKAEVSRGGVKTSELCAKTMESKHQKGLYFIGEVVDITGELGGYNLQWAFSSGIKCAKSL